MNYENITSNGFQFYMDTSIAEETTHNLVDGYELPIPLKATRMSMVCYKIVEPGATQYD